MGQGVDEKYKRTTNGDVEQDDYYSIHTRRPGITVYPQSHKKYIKKTVASIRVLSTVRDFLHKNPLQTKFNKLDVIGSHTTDMTINIHGF